MWALPVGSALVAVVAVSFMRVAIAALVVVILWLRRRIRRLLRGRLSIVRLLLPIIRLLLWLLLISRRLVTGLRLRRRRRALPALDRAQLLLELAVAVLQFLVLAGELAQAVFKLLDAQFGVVIAGLGERG